MMKRAASNPLMFGSVTRITLGMLAAAIVAATSVPARAGNETPEAKEAAARGAALANELLESAKRKLPTYREEGGRQGEGTVVLPSAGEVPLSDIAPGANPAKAAAIAEAAANDTTRQQAINESQTATAQDTSLAAQAYRSARNTNTSQTATLANDTALWGQTKTTFANADALAQQYTNCTTHTEYLDARNPDEGLIREQATCEVIHKPDVATISRDLSVRNDNYTLLDHTAAVTNTQTYSLLAAGGLAENEVLGAAEVSLEWSGTVASAAITEAPSAFNGWRVQVTVTPHSPPAAGGESVTIKVKADRTILEDVIRSTPDKPLMGSDSFCSARWTCEDSAPRTIGGVLIDSSIGSSLPPLYPTAPGNDPPSSASPMCWRATAVYDCPFNLGAMGCWQTPSGETRCHTSTSNNTTNDTCQALQHRDGCTPARTQCNGNAVGFGDFCYVETRTYECTKPIKITTIEQREHTECTGELACVGDNCIERPRTVTKNLPQAEAMLSVVQHVLSDKRVADGQPTIVHRPAADRTSASERTRSAAAPSARAGEPVWFTGDAYECRKATGSTTDCCTITQGNADTTWFSIYGRHLRRGNAPLIAGELELMGVPQEGSWKDLRDPQSWRYNILKKPLTSMIEDIKAGGSMPSDASSSMDPILAQYQQQRQQENASDWQCTRAERDLATLREAGMCESVGSYCVPNAQGACIESRNVYCCYNSPLSRQLVINAKGGQQGILNGALGTPTAPDCGGVGQSLVESIDPNQVDTAEWRGRHQQGSGYPDAATIRQATSQNALTGSGSALNTPGEYRPTVTERTQARLGTIRQGEARATIEADARTQALPPQAEATGAGEISLAPTFNTARAGQIANVSVRRTGSVGAVSVSFTTADGTAVAPTDYVPTSGTLHWSNGEEGVKTFQVTTMPRPASGTTPPAGLSLQVRLDNPTGGAVLGAVAGEIQISPGAEASAPTTGTAKIRVQQNLISVYPSLGNIFLVYQTTLTNVGTEPLRGIRLGMRFSRGSAGSLYGSATNPVTAPCYSFVTPGATVKMGNPVECSTPITLAPGQQVAIQPGLEVAATGPMETRCFGEAAGVDSGQRTWVTENECKLVSNAADAGGDSGAWAACYGPGQYHAKIEEFVDVFGGRTPPDSGGAATVRVGPTTLHSLGFTLPPAMVGSGSIAIRGAAPQLGGDTPIYARLSPCAGDWQFPNGYTPDYPFQSRACTNLAWDYQQGAFRLKDAISYRTTPTPPGSSHDDGECELTPGKRYYLTALAIDPRGWRQGQYPSTCTNDECGIEQAWSAVTMPATSSAPKVAAAAVEPPAPVEPALEGCPAPPAGYERSRADRSFETTFMQRNGGFKRDLPAIRMNKQQYAAIAFASPSDRGLLHQLDWTSAGSDGKAALVTISRCPGDTGARSEGDTAPPLHPACIGTSDGEPRSQGTILFQGGGQGSADHVCRLFPGRPYYINVFRMGIKGADEAVSGCSKKGVLSCGPKIRVR